MQKKSADTQDLMPKIPKLTDMFCKQQCESDAGITEAAGAETSDTETGVHCVPYPESETEAKLLYN